MRDNTDPLENLSRFSIPFRTPISLPVVSLVFETRPEMMPRIRQITEWHRKFFKFHREIIISNVDPFIPGTVFASCGTPPSPEMVGTWYSDMCVHHFASLCDAPYMLIWQWDGFVLNPEKWLDEFLNYDYVGAPLGGFWHTASLWFEQNIPGWQNPYRTSDSFIGGQRVLAGNGGFSMRSKKFLDASNSLSRTGWAANAEDLYLCLERRKELEEKGVKFCPAEVAKFFSRDSAVQPPLEDLFGFHSRDILGEVKQYLESKYLTSPVPVNRSVSPLTTLSA